MLYTYSMHYVNTSVFAVTQTTYCPRSFLLQNLNFLQVAFSFLIPFNILLKTLILLLKLFKMFFVVSKRNLKRSRKVNNRTEWNARPLQLSKLAPLAPSTEVNTHVSNYCSLSSKQVNNQSKNYGVIMGTLFRKQRIHVRKKKILL